MAKMNFDTARNCSYLPFDMNCNCRGQKYISTICKAVETKLRTSSETDQTGFKRYSQPQFQTGNNCPDDHKPESEEYSNE